MEQKKMKNGMVILLGLLSIVAVICITIGAYIIVNRMGKERDYHRHLELAQQYAEEENYEAAIQSYWAAISVDQGKENAYVELADVYSEIGESSKALSVYTMGYQRTGSNELQIRMNHLNTLLQDEDGDKEVKLLALNQTLLSNFAATSFEDYDEKYGIEEIDTSQADLCTVSYKNLDATFYFYNTEQDEEVLDAITHRPRQNSIPNEIELHDLNMLFEGMEDQITFDELKEYDLEELEIRQDAELQKTVVRFLANGCEVKIEASKDGTIMSKNVWNRMYPLNRVSADTGSHTLKGRVVNATTGDGVYGAKVELYHSEDTETVAASCVAEGDGSYLLENLEPDEYTAVVSAEGFIEESFPVIISNTGDTEMDFTVSPTLAVGEIRIVLTWGSSPSDLDSYLDGTASDGSRVHINFMDPNARKGNDLLAQLDVDDVDGYGPETTTIYDTQGSYSFHVNDFRSTGMLGASDAVVKIYMGDAEPIVLQVPTDAKNAWNVCKIEKGQVTVINEACEDEPDNW